MASLVAADFDAEQQAAWWPHLQAAFVGERLLRDRREAPADEIDIALVANPPVGSLRGLPKLRLIQSLWAGVDRLLSDASVPANVPLARMVDPAMNAQMAQTALWAVTGLHRAFFDYARQQRQATWRQWPLRHAADTTVAVLGMGEMGRASARRLAEEGYRVLGWSREQRAGSTSDSAPAPASASASMSDSMSNSISETASAATSALAAVELHAGQPALEYVLARADVVVNLLPLTADTRHLFDARRLAQLPRGASLVNLARGAHVDERALLAALDTGHLRHAVLDVFEVEPLPPTHLFWSHPSVTVLPHVAAQTDPSSASRIAARNVAALRAGSPLLHLVDRQRGY